MGPIRNKDLYTFFKDLSFKGIETKKLVMIAALFLLKTAGAQVSGHWRVPLNTFSDLDYSSSFILLTAKDGAAHDATSSGTAYPITQIKITPPAGKENPWLAMLLSGIAQGGDLRVIGTGSGGVVTVANTTTIFSVSK